MSPVDAASAYVGAPYRLRGRTPEGWDCWGCVAHLRREIFGRPTPSWADAYSTLDGARPQQLAEVVERLIAERIAAWSLCARRPGSVALFSIFDRPAHVGLILSPTDFIHALGGCETAIERLDSPRWATRLIGCFDA